MEGAATESAIEEAAIDVAGRFAPVGASDATTAEYNRTDGVIVGSSSGRVDVPPGVDETNRPPEPRERSSCLRRWVEFFAMVIWSMK